jgi:hypothetical protein
LEDPLAKEREGRIAIIPFVRWFKSTIFWFRDNGNVARQFSFRWMQADLPNVGSNYTPEQTIAT